ncbi:hypothetical protein BH10PSE10_BH10PSE10_04740 [soil metagenome]
MIGWEEGAERPHTSQRLYAYNDFADDAGAMTRHLFDDPLDAGGFRQLKMLEVLKRTFGVMHVPAEVILASVGFYLH